MNIPISACIIAQNEEKYIEKAIKNLLPNVSEVLVIDGGSTDNTIPICKNLGCRVNIHEFQFNFAAQRNYAMSICSSEWILFCDADEWFSESFYDILPTLLTKGTVKYPNCRGYHVFRISKFDGENVGEDFQWRVLRKNSGVWNGRVHEGFTFNRDFYGLKLPKERYMMHEHTMQKQLWSNKLYYNINQNIKKRPADNEGCDYQKDKWVDREINRNK